MKFFTSKSRICKKMKNVPLGNLYGLCNLSKEINVPSMHIHSIIHVMKQLSKREGGNWIRLKWGLQGGRLNPVMSQDLTPDLESDADYDIV